MNCPKCGTVNRRQAIRLTGNLYDPDNKAYYRRCLCSGCGRQFFTVEFEIECDKDILEAFDYATPPPKARVESSKKRFEEFRKTQKRVRQMQRSGIK